MRPWLDDRLMVAKAGTVFDAAGELTDAHVREQLTRFVSGFADFAKRNAASLGGGS
jgi:chromate reductase, NAD(P)H dehydrogenase (quinone)